MVARPFPRQGDYFRTRPPPTRVRCRAYTAPPNRGGLICSITPGTTLGPVEASVHSGQFVTIMVRGWWVNVWSAERGGVNFAYRCEDAEVADWHFHGWLDRF